MTIKNPRVGDILIWSRSDGKYVCHVLEVLVPKKATDPARVKIRVEGWLGTEYRTLNYEFEKWEGPGVPELKRNRDNALVLKQPK